MLPLYLLGVIQMFGKKKDKEKKIVVKLYMEKAQVYSGCFDIDYGETEDFNTFHLKTETETVKEYMPRLREEFGTEYVDYQSLDPRNILLLPDVFKYKIKGKEPLWVIQRPNGEVYKIFRGMPPYEELRDAIRQLLIEEGFLNEEQDSDKR